MYLHLRFHGYGNGEWTDSAVRRYVTDAGPLLDRLHKLVRSDCTTRNRRRAAALQRSYDSLEERIAALREQEELDAIRPDLDGNAIMQLLGAAAGPARRPGLQAPAGVRMERGPLSTSRPRRSCGAGPRRTAWPEVAGHPSGGYPSGASVRRATVIRTRGWYAVQRGRSLGRCRPAAELEVVGQQAEQVEQRAAASRPGARPSGGLSSAATATAIT